jgi:hypothetical protein
MRIVGAVLLLLAGIAAPAHALTPQEAQTLPLAELARRALGDVGAQMVLVERSRPSCGGSACPAEVTPGTPQWPTSLTFHARPLPAGTAGPDTLCMSQTLFVLYDEEGAVRGPVISGSTFKAVRAAVDDRPGERAIEKMERAMRGQEQLCAGLSPADFFSAHDGEAARTALLAVRAIAAALANGDPRHIVANCTAPLVPGGGCRTAARSALDVQRISGVEEWPCVWPAFKGLTGVKCYQIVLNSSISSEDSIAVAIRRAGEADPVVLRALVSIGSQKVY